MSTVEPRFGNTILNATSDPFPVIGANSLYSAVSALSAGAAIDGQGTAFPATPVQGQWFLRTDTGVQYRWDGTQWRFITAGVVVDQVLQFNLVNIIVGANSNGTSATTQSVAIATPGQYRFESTYEVHANVSGSTMDAYPAFRLDGGTTDYGSTLNQVIAGPDGTTTIYSTALISLAAGSHPLNNRFFTGAGTNTFTMRSARHRVMFVGP